MDNVAEESKNAVKSKHRWWVRPLAGILALALMLELAVTSAGRVTLEETGEGDAADAAAEYLLDSTAYTSQGAWTRAKLALRSGLRKPETYGDYEVLASVALAREEYDKALPYLDKCLELYDGGDSGRATLWMKRACAQALQGELRGALDSLENMFALGYSSDSAYLLRAQINFGLENYDAAEEDLTAYVELAPADMQMLATLAELAYSNGSWQKAADCYTVLLSYPKSEFYSDELLLRRAACYLQLKRSNLGIADCDKYIATAGEGDGSARFLRAVMKAAAGENETALDDYLLAASLGYEQSALCYEQAALCAYDLRDYESCIKYGELALEAGGALNGEAVLYENMGLAAMALSDLPEAERWMTRALELDAALAELYYFRGVVRLSSEDYQKAAEDFSAAIELDQNQAICFYDRSIAYINLGENQKAIDDLLVAAGSGDEEIAKRAEELMKALAG